MLLIPADSIAALAVWLLIERLSEEGFLARTVAVGSLSGVARNRARGLRYRASASRRPVDRRLQSPSRAPRYHLEVWRQRIQGFAFRPRDARFAGKSAHEALDAAVADPSSLMINRYAGAGTRILIDQLLGGCRPQGYANQPESHNAVVAAVAQGRADWGIAIATVAKLYAMAFLPISPECYDFLVSESRCSRPAVQAFLATLAVPDVRERIAALGMKFD